MTDLKVALVGLGTAGHTLHLPALADLPGVAVVGAFDSLEERRTRAAARWKVPVSESVDALLATGPDVVIVGTPPDSHADYCLRALDAGAHVICEKPFASSIDEADTILAAAASAGLGVVVNHDFREMPIFRAVRDEVGTSVNGPLVFVQVWQLMDLPPWREPGWRGQLLQRTLYEAGTHLVDYVMGLFQEKPIRVQAVTSSCGVREDESDAVALVTLEFSGGRLAQITQNRLSKGETQYFEVRADTARTSLRASFGGRARLLGGLFRSTRPRVRFEWGVSGLAWRERADGRTIVARNPRDPGVVATRRVFADAFDAFRRGTPTTVSGQQGRDVLEVIAACYHAAAVGRRVTLDSPEVRDLASQRLGAVADR